MKKKEQYFDEYFDNKKDNIAFITLKKGAKITFGSKFYETKDELPVPLTTDGLIRDIQKQDEYDGVTVSHIIEGIVYLLGCDKTFEHKNEYKDIIDTLGFDIEPYVIHLINQLDDKKSDIAVVYGKFLININENAKNCFVYASCLERKAILILSKNAEDKEANYFMNESLVYYEKSLDYDETFALSYYKLGYYYKNKQLYIKAKLYWEKELEYDDDTERTNEIRAEIEQLEVYVQYETGYNYVLNGDAQKGLDLLLPLVNTYNNWWNLLFFVGLAYRTLEQYDIAARYLENVLQIEEGQIHALNELGLCRMCLKKYEAASDAFTAFLAQQPKNSEVLCNRAASYYYMGETEKARKDLENALKISPNDEVATELMEIVTNNETK